MLLVRKAEGRGGGGEWQHVFCLTQSTVSATFLGKFVSPHLSVHLLGTLLWLSIYNVLSGTESGLGAGFFKLAFRARPVLIFVTAPFWDSLPRRVF